jgi:CRP/FNR family transcriptional regulator, cyclic AMP receptor protein
LRTSYQSNPSRPRQRSIAREAPTRVSSIRQPNLLAKLLGLDPKLQAHIKFRRFPPGELFFQQGDRQRGVYIIRTGTARAFYTAPSGREMTLAYWQAGDLLGADRLYGGGVFRWSCQAVSPTEAYSILDADLRTLIANIPELAVALVKRSALRCSGCPGSSRF